MDYRRSEFVNIENQRCRCSEGMMNLVVTPLSCDFKKSGAGFGPPLHCRHHDNYVHLTCKLLSWGWQRRGGVKKSLSEPCSIVFKVTTNFELPILEKFYEI